MGRRRRERKAKAAADRDRQAARAFTAQVVRAYLDGSKDQVQVLPTRFPPSIGPDEKILCGSWFRRDWFGALGDGSYRTAAAFGTGRMGTALMLGALIGNSKARKNAERAAQPMWRPFDQGTIYVSDHGFYLDTQRGPLSFGWGALVECDLADEGMVQLLVRMDSGAVERFRIYSPYAELVLLSWALARHPDHQYLAHYRNRLRGQ